MIYPIRTIVAGIAELHEDDPVLAEAVELASRTGAMLHLVHAFALPDPMLSAYAGMGYMSGEALQEYSRSRTEVLASLVPGGLPAERIRCHVVAGPPAPMIHHVVTREGADLILVGATRRGSLGRSILGTTAQRVIRGASSPVLVLRSPMPDRYRRVLLTTDLSPFSAGIHEAGLDVLETLFGQWDVELRSLMVVLFSLPLPPPLGEEALQDVSRKALERFLGERRDRGRRVEGVVRYGDPAKEIAAEAADWGADLVVLGTHGRPTPERWIVGSVAEGVVRGIGTNVLVVPARVEEQRTLPVRIDQVVEAAAAQPAS